MSSVINSDKNDYFDQLILTGNEVLLFQDKALFQDSAFFQDKASTLISVSSKASVHHSHQNEKTVWNQESYCWYFCLNLKYRVWLYREYIKTAKNGGFYEELVSENDFEAVLTTFCCYDYDANASQAAQKIVADQKDYHNALRVLVAEQLKYINQ